MSRHRAIPACNVPRAPNTTGPTLVRHFHMRLISTRKSPYFANFSACFLPTLPSVGQLISMRRQVLAFLSLRHVRSVGFDLPCSDDGRIPYHHDVVRLHKPIRLMPVPPGLHCNLKMLTNVPVDDGGNLIMSLLCRYYVCRYAPVGMGEWGLYPHLGAHQHGRNVPTRYLFLYSPHSDQ